MAGLDEALERLITDPGFRDALTRDPAAALAGYDLTDGEQAVLAAQVDPDPGAGGAVEQRTSKSAMLTALTTAAEALASGEQVPADNFGRVKVQLPEPDQHSGTYMVTGVSHSGAATAADSEELVAPADGGEASGKPQFQRSKPHLNIGTYDPPETQNESDLHFIGTWMEDPHE